MSISHPAVHITWYAMFYHLPKHSYCWWFRNPIPNHLGCIPNPGNNLPTSTGLSRRIWSINSSFTFAKAQFSLQATPNKQYWNTSPSRHHHRTPGSWFLKLHRSLQTLKWNSGIIFMYKKTYTCRMHIFLHKVFLWLMIDELSSFDSVFWKLFQAKTTKDYVTQGAFCALWQKRASLFFHEGNGQVHSQLLTPTGFRVMFRDSWWLSSG